MMAELAPLLPMLLALTWAAAEDVRTRKIRNWLTVPLAAAGVAVSLTPYAAVGPADAVLGLGVGFLVPFLLFAIGAMGGGDVKLFAAVGAWVGPQAVFTAFLVAAIAGGVMALAVGVWTGSLRLLARNVCLAAITLAHTKQLGVEHIRQSNLASRTGPSRAIPFGVAIWVGTLWVLLVPR